MSAGEIRRGGGSPGKGRDADELLPVEGGSGV
jgi:hypothetical protein